MISSHESGFGNCTDGGSNDEPDDGEADDRPGGVPDDVPCQPGVVGPASPGEEETIFSSPGPRS